VSNLFFTFIYFYFYFLGRRKEYDDSQHRGNIYQVPVNEEGWSFREIDPKDLKFDSELGRGAYGTVPHPLTINSSSHTLSLFEKVYRGSWRGADVVRVVIIYPCQFSYDFLFLSLAY